MGAFSIAVSNPLPKEAKGAKGARAAAMAVLDKNDLLDVDIVIVLFFFLIE
jgi:hypothetical protein